MSKARETIDDVVSGAGEVVDDTLDTGEDIVNS